MNEKTLKISVHILAWVIFFTLPVVLFFRMNLRMDMLWLGMLPNLVLVAYFYTNLHVLVPKFLFQKKTLAFLAFTVGIAIVYALVIPHPQHHLDPREIGEHFHRIGQPRPKIFMPLILILLFLFVFILSTGIKILEELFDARQKKQNAETAKSKAELANLRNQINPHFLFNTLNSIYSLSVENSPKTSDAIMRLSGMMRYVLTESESEFVPMSVEIDYLNEYIQLQELRLTEKTKVHFTIDGDFEKLQIAPLLLEPFIENAFKYGVSVREDSDIAIHIQLHETSIGFTVRNRMFDNGLSTLKMGINNVTQRLLLLYPDKHTLSIIEHDGIFEINLEITIV